MATQTQIDTVRFYICDEDSSNYEFTSQQIENFINEGNSVNYATYRLAKILMSRLRKELLVKSDTGEESESLAPLKERLELLKEVYNNYKELYEAENNNTVGRYISTVKPTIAGGDI